jgi:hypothetical protein
MGISIEQCASIVPVLEHTIVILYTNEKLSDLYKDIPIATQCGLLSAHIIKLTAVTCNNMSTDFCKRYMTVHKNISLRYVHC